MTDRRLILVLGDQLSRDNPALRDAVPGRHLPAVLLCGPLAVCTRRILPVRAATDPRCLSQVPRQTLNLGHAHHIQRQRNHCAQCRYSPAKTTGEGACPYNALYWRFIHRHQRVFEDNPRMTLVPANWRKRGESAREAILDWADRVLRELVPVADPR